MSLYANSQEIKNYGYVPLTFPRDPANVNLFAEHIVLGQILEPVVDTDTLGNVTPGVAESWVFEDAGLTIKLKIRNDRHFSNGVKLTARDVKYTIDRMIEKKSQSSNFLKSVKQVIATETNDVIIKLSEANVAILKALSRDQLGIVPNGWVFDKDSKEPFVGTGPYNLKEIDNLWYLIENEKYVGGKKPFIKKWRLIYLFDQDGNIPKTPVPDYAPAITYFAKNALEKTSGPRQLKYLEQVSFAQTSAWWHPSGKNFKSLEFRTRAMSFIEQALSLGTEKLKLERATGVIPKGVSGYVDFDARGVPPKQFAVKKLSSLKIGLVGSIFDDILASVEFATIAKRYGFTLEIIKIQPNEIKNIGEKKIDIVCAGWAGGFNDPEGFIALLPTYLGEEFPEYIGERLSLEYTKGRIEQNWTTRGEIFKNINSELRKTQLMVPGWKIPFFISGSPKLVSEEASFRYTPRLQSVKEK